MPSMLNTGYWIVYLKWHTQKTKPKDHIIIINTISPMDTVPALPQLNNLAYILPLPPPALFPPESWTAFFAAFSCNAFCIPAHEVNIISDQGFKLHHPSILQPFCSHNWSQHSVIILPTLVITVGAWIFANSSFSRTRFLQYKKSFFM